MLYNSFRYLVSAEDFISCYGRPNVEAHGTKTFCIEMTWDIKRHSTGENCQVSVQSHTGSCPTLLELTYTENTKDMITWIIYNIYQGKTAAELAAILTRGQYYEVYLGWLRK